MNRNWLFPPLCMIGLLALCLFIRTLTRPGAIAPEHDALYVSTRYITCIALAPDGTVWAGCLGGVLQRRPGDNWRHFTRLDGLPTQEVLALRVDVGHVTAITPLGEATFHQDRWGPVDAKTHSVQQQTRLPGQIATTIWCGETYAASPIGLFVQRPKATSGKAGLPVTSTGSDPSKRQQPGAHQEPWREVPLPPSTGTHVSALLPQGTTLWAALYGDGLWAYDGRQWRKVDIDLPQAAREITAIAGDDRALWVGTRREGLWERQGAHWTHWLQPNEPINHNCQALCMFHDCLYVSTLEDGLAVRTSQGWDHLEAPTISSNAPRQMVVWQDRLYVRHGNGKLDRTDGRNWELNIGAHLPRRQVSALAADHARLYLAQWGGWTEFDGKTWTHYLNVPELQGLPVTALLPDRDRVWIGTQGRGVAEYQRATGALRWHDERDGLPDDWVTTLTQWGGRLYAGTFVGGLAVWDGKRWQTRAELAGENVTAVEPSGNAGLFIATRHGTWLLSGNDPMRRFSGRTLAPDPEVQALCQGDTGIWIGARTGLYFIRQP